MVFVGPNVTSWFVNCYIDIVAAPLYDFVSAGNQSPIWYRVMTTPGYLFLSPEGAFQSTSFICLRHQSGSNLIRVLNTPLEDCGDR